MDWILIVYILSIPYNYYILHIVITRGLFQHLFCFELYSYSSFLQLFVEITITIDTLYDFMHSMYLTWLSAAKKISSMTIQKKTASYSQLQCTHNNMTYIFIHNTCTIIFLQAYLLEIAAAPDKSAVALLGHLLLPRVISLE